MNGLRATIFSSEDEWLSKAKDRMVKTLEVEDGVFETVVSDVNYNWIPVATSKNKVDAKQTHDATVEFFRNTSCAELKIPVMEIANILGRVIEETIEQFRRNK